MNTRIYRLLLVGMLLAAPGCLPTAAPAPPTTVPLTATAKAKEQTLVIPIVADPAEGTGQDQDNPIEELPPLVVPISELKARALDGDPGPEPFVPGEPIDVLIVHTEEAEASVGGAEEMAELANRVISDSNQICENTGVEQRLRLVGLMEVQYPEESGDEFWRQTSYDLRNGEGIFGQVHVLREELGADMVSMFLADGSWCGLATQLGPNAIAYDNGYCFRGFPYSLVSTVQACTNKWTFTHEAGHNMGCQHNIEDVSNYPAYPYSYGFRTLDPPAFRTVMAYDDNWQYPRVPYFSNNTLLYEGLAMGIPDLADNARTLSNTYPIAATWYPTEVAQDIFPSQVITPGLPVLRGTVLITEANVRVSTDGVVWQDAETDGVNWSLDWNPPPGIGQQELYLQVNKGMSLTHTLISADAFVQGSVLKVITVTKGITATVPLTGASVFDGDWLTTTTDVEGNYGLWIPSGARTIQVFKVEDGLEYTGQAEIVATAGVTYTLDFTLTGVPPVYYDYLPLVIKD